MFLSEVKREEPTAEQIDRLLFGKPQETLLKSDVAIVLGTDPRYIERRCEPAASYYRRGGTERLIVSGGAVHDKAAPESRFMKQILTDCGIPEEAVTEEPDARDTIGNFICSLNLLNRQGDITAIRRVAIITEPFHMRRSLLLAHLLLPRYMTVFGYTEHTDDYRNRWKTDGRLNQCVYNEIGVFQTLISGGLIEDIPL